MKKITFLLILTMLISIISAQDFSIFFTNDTHGRIIAEKVTDEDGNQYYEGGADYMSELLRLMRKKYTDNLFVDAGDIFHGAFVTDYFEGKPQIEVMNMLGYNIFVPGNHDMAFGIEKLEEYARNSRFFTLSANLVREKTDREIFLPYIIHKIGNIKIGMVGMLTPTTMLSALDNEKKGINVLDYDKVLPSIMEKLKKEKVNKIIFVSHSGIETDRELALKYQPDFIIGSHSHTLLFVEEKVGKTVIMQAGAHYKFLGHLRLDIEKDEIIDYRYTVYRVNSKLLNPDKKITEHIKKYDDEVERYLDETVGYLEKEINGTREVTSSELFLFINKTLEKATGSDFAQLNNSGLRAGLKKGNVKRRDVYTVLPFGNQTVIVEVKGEDLLNDPWIYKYRNIEKEKIYKVAINSYMAEKNDTFREKALSKKFLDKKVREFIVDELKKTK